MLLEINENFWKYNYYSSLDVKDLFNVVKTCKQLNRQKKYIYKLIYTKLIHYTRSTYNRSEKATIYTNNIIIIKNIIIIIKNNKIIRDMFQRYTCSRYQLILYNFKKKIDTFLKNEFSLQETVIRLSKDYDLII